jgi:hypothetical protein
MTDDGTEQEPGSLSGEVEPSGPGEWLTYKVAAERWGIDPKAVYRRVKRGRAKGRRNPDTGASEVWVPAAEEPGSISSISNEDRKEEPRSLAAPDPERFALAIEASIGRALSPLHETIDKQQARIEELVRENERLRLDEERRSREREQEQRERQWWKRKWW